MAQGTCRSNLHNEGNSTIMDYQPKRLVAFMSARRSRDVAIRSASSKPFIWLQAWQRGCKQPSCSSGVPYSLRCMASKWCISDLNFGMVLISLPLMYHSELNMSRKGFYVFGSPLTFIKWRTVGESEGALSL